MVSTSLENAIPFVLTGFLHANRFPLRLKTLCRLSWHSASRSGSGSPRRRASVTDLIERQADDIGVGADHLDHERAGDALHGIAAGLAAPFAGADIGLDVVLAQALEAHAGLDQALAKRLLRRHQADRGVDAVVAARQQPQALRGLVDQIGFGQDAPADRDHGVGGEDEGAAQFVIELHRFQRGIGLGARQPVGAGARQLAPPRRLVDVGRAQRVGLDAGLVEQRQAPRRAGSKYEFGTAEHADVLGWEFGG